MAETVVIANVLVDSKGVTSGIDKSNKALKKGEAAAKKFGKTLKVQEGITQKFGKELINLRSALTSIAGTIGILAVLSAIAIALKNVVVELISSITWFDKLGESIRDTWRAFALGETALAAMGRKLKKFGIVDLFEVREQYRELTRQQKVFQETLERGSKAELISIPNPFAPGQSFNFIKFEKLSKDDIPLMRKELGLVTDRIKKFEETLFGAAEGFDAFGFAGIAKPKEVTEAIDKARKALAVFEGVIATNPKLTALMNQGIDNLIRKLLSLKLTAEEVAEALGIAFAKPEKTFDDMIASMAGSMDKATILFNMFQTAARGVANAIAQALLEGGVSMKQAIIGILKDMARMMITYAVMWLAFAAMATTKVGAILLGGTPAMFLKGALLMFVAAAAAGAASAALGGRGAGSESASGNVPEGAPGSQGTRTNPIVTVNVDGFVGNENELARSIAKALATATADGAVG